MGHLFGPDLIVPCCTLSVRLFPGCVLTKTHTRIERSALRQLPTPQVAVLLFMPSLPWLGPCSRFALLCLAVHVLHFLFCCTPIPCFTSLAMAPTGHLQVPQLAPFLHHPGDPLVPFKTWVATFNSWLSLVELERGEALANKTKNSLLFGLLGSEGLCQFGGDPIMDRMADDATTDAAFQATIQKCFQRPKTIARARFDFRNRQQGPSETAAAPACQFPANYLDSALAEQILFGCHSVKAHERMLLIDPLTLDEYQKVLKSDKAVHEDSAVFSATSSMGKSLMGSVHTLGGQGRFSKSKSKVGSGQSNFSKWAQNKGECFGCGSRDHMAKSDQCLAKNSQCRFCHRTGHYESVCFTKRRSLEASMATSGDAGHMNVLSHQIVQIKPMQNSVSDAPCYSIHDLGLSIQGIPSLPPGSAIASCLEGDQMRYLQPILPDAPSLQVAVSNLPSVIAASSPVSSSEEWPSCPVCLVSPDTLVYSQLPLPTYPCPLSCLCLLFGIHLTARLCLVQLETDGAFSSQFPLTLLAHSRLHAYRPLTTCVHSLHLLCLGRPFSITFPGCACNLHLHLL